MDSFNASGSKLLAWKSTGISNYSDSSNMNVVVKSKGNHPILTMGGIMRVYLNGNYFTQNKALKAINKTAVNIYIVYKLDPISSTRNTDYTIQNALFGAMKITKNTDSSKYNYNGYGLCFDEGSEFGHTVRQGNFDRTTNAKNVIIFGADMSSIIHMTNRANNIYVMSQDFIQGINDTTIYAEKLCHNNFKEFGVIFVLSLHYNVDNSYLFANGRQELKFKAKDDQLINEKCMSRPKIINLNADEPVFYPLSIKVNKCGGDCNNINDPMAKLCMPDIVRDVNIKVFNLLARINETRKVVCHVCRLTSAVCNDRQEWNENKCRCECKEDLINKLVCDKGYMWNPHASSCECDIL